MCYDLHRSCSVVGGAVRWLENCRFHQSIYMSSLFFLSLWPDWSNTPSSCWRRMRSVCASKYCRHWGKWWQKTGAMGRRYVPSVFLFLIFCLLSCPRFTHTWDKTLYWHLRMQCPCPNAPNLLEHIRSKNDEIKEEAELCLVASGACKACWKEKIHTDVIKSCIWNCCSQGRLWILCVMSSLMFGKHWYV